MRRSVILQRQFVLKLSDDRIEIAVALEAQTFCAADVEGAGPAADDVGDARVFGVAHARTRCGSGEALEAVEHAAGGNGDAG